MNRQIRSKLYGCLGFAVLVSMAASIGAHRQHISWTQIEYNAEAGVVEISHRLHEHDLHGLLKQLTGREGELARMEDRAKIATYVAERFFIQVDLLVQSPALLGAELSGPYLFVYQEVKVTTAPSIITLSSSMLMDVFDDQVNMINVVTSSGVETLELDQDSGEQRIELPD